MSGVDGKGWEVLVGQCLIGAGWGLVTQGRGGAGGWDLVVKEEGSCVEVARPKRPRKDHSLGYPGPDGHLGRKGVCHCC